MTGDIENFVKSCLSCVENKVGRKKKALLAIFTAGAHMEKKTCGQCGTIAKVYIVHCRPNYKMGGDAAVTRAVSQKGGEVNGAQIYH